MTDFDDEDLIMSDEALLDAIDALHEEGDEDVGELLKMMNENRIISWEEAERILSDTHNGPVKCSLPPQTRPSEPDNDTDVEQCIRKLQANDPNLTQINLNNMKRIAVPQIRRIIDALRENGFLEKLSLANMGLYDHDLASLIDILEINETLRSINLETNYLSGDFFSKLFQSALKNQTLEEVKAVNQGLSFSTEAERAIIDAVFQNRGLTKVSIQLRLPEGRHKVDQAMLRNQEIRRVLRKQMAEEQNRLEGGRNKKQEPEVAQPPLPPKKRPIPQALPTLVEENKCTKPMPVYKLQKKKEPTTPESKEFPMQEAPPPESPKKKVAKKKKLPEVTINTDVHIIKDHRDDDFRAEEKIAEKRKVPAEKVKKKIMCDAFIKLTKKASDKKLLGDNSLINSPNSTAKIPTEIARPMPRVTSFVKSLVENGPLDRIREEKEKGPRPIDGITDIFVGAVTPSEKKPELLLNGPLENNELTERIKRKKKIIKKVLKKRVKEDGEEIPGLSIEKKFENEVKLNGETKNPSSPTKTVRPTNEKIPKLKSAFEPK